MPGFNGRGPAGNGPGTGRGLGHCGTGVQKDAESRWGNRFMQEIRNGCRRFMGGKPDVQGVGGRGRGLGLRGRFNSFEPSRQGRANTKEPYTGS